MQGRCRGLRWYFGLILFAVVVIGAIGASCTPESPACAAFNGIDPTSAKAGEPVLFIAEGLGGFDYQAQWYPDSNPDDAAAIQEVTIDPEGSGASIVPIVPPGIYSVIVTAVDPQTTRNVCNTGKFQFEVLPAVSIDHLEVDESAGTLKIAGDFPPILPPDSPQVTLDGAALKVLTFNTQKIGCKLDPGATGSVQVTAKGEASNIRRLSILTGQVRDIVTGKNGGSQAIWDLSFRVDLGDYASPVTVETAAVPASTFTWTVSGADLTGCQAFSKIGADPPYVALAAGSPAPGTSYFAASIKITPITGGGHRARISHSALVVDGQQIDGSACNEPTRTEDFTAGSEVVEADLNSDGSLPEGDRVVGAGSLGDVHIAWDQFACQNCP
jgi:hypothetical protein